MLPGKAAIGNGPSVAAIILNFMLMGYVSATYFTYSDVVELNADNFDKLVVNSDGVALVHFYAPWSGHCKQLASKINAAAVNLKGIALIGAVDCTDKEASRNLCQQYPTPGFPTLKLFGPDKTKNPYTGTMMKQPTDHKGGRTSKDLVDAVTSLLTDVHINRIRNAADLHDMRASSKAAGKAQVLLFTDKESTSSLYKGLSMQLYGRGLLFGQVHSSATELLAEFGVEAFPKLLVLKVDGGSETYTGELKAPALLEFLLGFATSSESASSEGERQEGGGGDGKGASSSGKGGGKAAAGSFVRQVEGLDELVTLESREDMALLAVHGAEGEDGCKAAREAFLSAAGEMQAVVDTLLVSVPAADLTRGSAGAAALSRIGVDVGVLAAEPCELQVVLLPFGKDKSESDIQLKYSGPPDGKELQQWVTGEVPNMVSELDDMSASAFLMADPSSGAAPVAPKVLLFTNKDEAPGVFRALAVALRGRGNMAFGWVQANSPSSRATMESFKPPKVPSLLVVLPTMVPDEETAEPRLRFGMQPYFGPLKYTPMRAFLEQMAKEVEMSAGIMNDPELIRKTLPQITNQSDFQSVCTEPAGMCLLALLDGTAAGFEEERKSLLSAAIQHSRSNSALHFAWLDARQHRSVMQAFGVLASDLPALVALSARRMRFGLLQSGGRTTAGGSGPLLRPDLVSQFIGEVLSAKIRTEPLQALPEIREGDAAASDAAADGSDAADGDDAAAAAAVEEEFDLSDVMSEEVEGGAAGGAKADRLAEIDRQLEAEEEARRAAEQAAKSGGSKKTKKSKKSKKGKKSKSKSSSSSEEL